MAEVQGKNGYLAVKPTPDSAQHLARLLDGAGITGTIPADKLHVTLFYAPDGLPESIRESVNPEQVHLAFVQPTPRILGEGTWRAVVLELDAQSLHQRHNSIRTDHNGQHSYPDYTPHLSVKYSPEDGDLEKIVELFAGIPNLALQLHGEYCEDID